MKLIVLLCLYAALPLCRGAELTLAPAEPGVPAAMGGEARAAAHGGRLYLTGKFPELGGKVLARSFGRNPVWDRDLVGSPEVEDRAVFVLEYTGASGAARAVSIAINPWGAYRTEEKGELLTSLEIPVSAQVTPDGWNIEAAVPVGSLEVGGDRAVRVRAERIRSRRSLVPEFRWTAKPVAVTVTDEAADAPRWKSPPLGNTDPPLEIGRVLTTPPVIARWDHPAWQHVTAFELPRNEPYPRRARYATQVKWVHDGRTLALLLRMDEPEPVVARAGGRDSNVTSDDHVALYLATDGAAFLQIAVNTVGAIADARGGGPLRMRPQSSWNASIQIQTDIRHGHWIARIDIPLEECAQALGETGVPRGWRVLVTRLRAARPGEAAEQASLPVIGGASTFYGPIRYRRAVAPDISAWDRSTRNSSRSFWRPPE